MLGVLAVCITIISSVYSQQSPLFSSLHSLVVFLIVYFSIFLMYKLGTRHIVETMQTVGHHINTLFMCGGLSKNPLFVQMHADIMGKSKGIVKGEDNVFSFPVLPKS